MKFTYRWGQRPLEGYTIKRGLGQGGFGEVYFAVSDGGKEVALKLIRGHSDIELRGIANCLNLKHPNLVHLYDLKVDAQGDRWLAMEFVQGEPLASILRRSPRGLPEAQAREWFLQAARAVDYLHDHAVVHRDIKPANLFIENGIVKLGDYGLSKSVGASQQSQSSNVGTIHYMAPEVASGAYSKQIDIYACGVMLYEMLTGEVPFKGESWAEIAIKHQTDLPDMSNVPAAYVPILEKALNKRAERRFSGMGEMIQAVESIAAPKVSSISPSPTHTTATSSPMPMIKAPLSTTMPNTASPSRETAWPDGASATPPSLGRSKAGDLATSLFLAPFASAPATAIWAIFTGTVNWSELGPLFVVMVLVSWAVLICSKLWEGESTSRPRRLALLGSGALIGLFAFTLQGWALPELLMNEEAPMPSGMAAYWGGLLRMEQSGMPVLINFVLFFTLALGLPRWWQAAERKRPERFTFYAVFAAAACGLVLSMFWGLRAGHDDPGAPGYVVLALAGAAAVVQLVSRWVPPSRTTSRFRRRLQNAPSREERRMA